MSDNQMQTFLNGVVGVVEANSFETMCLWKEYTEELKKTWLENPSGLGQQIGILAGMPIFISLNTAIIDGKKILFIDPTSQVVDYRIIDKWLEENLPKTAYTLYGRINKTNAMNFCNVLR